MAGKSTSWTAERRAAQAARIRAQKPWEQATGPRTAAGKAICAQNAFKHGARTPEFREICALLRAQAAGVKAVLAADALGITPPSE